MQATAYKMQIGQPAPAFSPLKGVDGKTYNLDAFKDHKAVVVFWHCNHCPYSNAFEDRLNQVAAEYGGKGVGFLAINSNDASEYPEDSFEHMVSRARAKALVFPYVYDESQQVAETFGAVCTPHLFVFGPDRKLAYQGRVDGEKDDPKKGNASDLRNALDDVLGGRAVRTSVTMAFGCSIKWNQQHFVRLRA